jgi:uncharacterized protein with HEPN domain
MLNEKDHIRLRHMLDYSREALILIHGYDSVDLDILWGILTEELPSLVVALEKIN